MVDQGYTVKEAAEQLGVAIVTVRKMIRDGRLEAHRETRKHGMTWVIAAEDLRAYRDRQSAPVTQVYTPSIPDHLSSLDQGLSRVEQSSITVIQEIRDLSAQVRILQDEIAALRAPRRRRRWPWGR